MKKRLRQERMLTPSQIVKTLERNNAQLKGLGVQKLGLFGSYIKNKHRGSSDIDFIVKLRKPTLDSYMELKFFLEKTFKKKADVVIEGNIKPALSYIKKEAKYVKGL